MYAMIDTTPKMLLFIEPQNQKSDTPLIDELTKKMSAAFKGYTTGSGFEGQFMEDAGTMGWHTCVCGAKSTNVDYLLPSGFITNSLCVHYLAWHRGEVLQSELDKLATLPNEFAEPTPEQLK